MSKYSFAISLISLALGAAASAQTISTYPNWDGSSGISPFGNSNTSTYGQTLTAPALSFLKSYKTSFLYNTGDPFSFRFYVAAWDEATNRIVGGLLYESGDVTSAASGAGFVSYTFNTNLALTPGSRYVAFTSTSTQLYRPGGLDSQAFIFSDAYAGGKFVYQNNGTDFSSLASSAWDTGFSYGDTAFEASFQAVPEPASLAILALGTLGLLRRRAKR